MDKIQDLMGQTFTLIHCDRFYVVGTRVNGRDKSVFKLRNAMAVRQQGKGFALDTMPGWEVTIHANDFPAMVVEITPDGPSYAGIIKAYQTVETQLRVAKSGIIVPDGKVVSSAN